jgi:anti-anti-sigma regulatory factor
MVARMGVISMLLKLDEKQIVPALQEVGQKLGSANDEVVLDFSAVRRIGTDAVRAIEELAGKADEKAVKIVLRSVNVDVYKVLKLVKLASRFCFAA